ncbi:uncharacterized protein LOC62_01G000737 [Vanrija pseudolonga]|uniref:Uncharacterized protein n=1 Tax=Vanrija pseudolonga TaxID=143232 RepID=A0AAF0Y0V1_9TREE|nr:hypothetical protein LOC62_01G000737 [Vanrija pseudolonga]
MGGKNFGTEARRFTTAEHDAMFALARERTGHFFTSMKTYPPLTSKATHGDIDILAGWAGLGWAPPKGREGGVVEGADPFDATLTTVTLSSDSADVRRWCNAIAAAVGATEWQRSGGCLSTRFPASALYAAVPSLASPHDAADFFQVDFMLFPPEGVEFASFGYSYGSALMLLAPLLRQGTGVHGLVLHAHCLIFRHSPFPGLRPVDTHLSHDAAALCKYIGLDHATWLRGDFDTMADVYAWLSTAEEGSITAKALRRIARKGIDRDGRKTSHHKGRYDLYTDFIQYLQASAWAPSAEERAELEARAAAAEAERGEREPTPARELDPDNPTPLTPAEVDALEYWGAKGAYAALVAELEPEARLLHSRQNKPRGTVKFPPKRGPRAVVAAVDASGAGVSAERVAADTATAPAAVVAEVA